MADNIVSVRMPEQLHKDLKRVAAEQYYMDVSEAIRSLLRRKLSERDSAKVIDDLQNLLQKLGGAQNEQ